jgi:SagB-type dehydrogenase family enzyme
MRPILVEKEKCTVSSRLAVFVLVAGSAFAQELKPVLLPKPQTEGGKPLMQALSLRKSEHSEYSPEKLSPQVLSNLLWAAYGVNRPDGRRTAPSANNTQSIEIYVALAEGLYRYDHKAHTLEPVSTEDVRAAANKKPLPASVDLIYVSDFAKLKGTDESKTQNSWAESGFVGQNVYLFCASEGLATVVRGSVDRERLAPLMKLRPEQRITLDQPVGYPKK